MIIINDREVTTINSMVTLDSRTLGRSTLSMLPASRVHSVLTRLHEKESL